MTIHVAFTFLRIVIDTKAKYWKRILPARSAKEEAIKIELTFTIINFDNKMKRDSYQSSINLKFMKAWYQKKTPTGELQKKICMS